MIYYSLLALVILKQPMQFHQSRAGLVAINGSVGNKQINVLKKTNSFYSFHFYRMYNNYLILIKVITEKNIAIALKQTIYT